MIEWFYLAFGFGLLSAALYPSPRIFHRSLWETAKNSFSLLMALAILLGIDRLSSRWFWIPAGQESSRWASLFLTALLAGEALVRLKVSERNFLPLLGFSFWTALNGH